MATANTADFLGEGTNTGAFAPMQTPAQIAEAKRQEELRRQRKLEADAQATSAGAAGYRQVKGENNSWDIANPELSVYESEAEKKRRLENGRGSVWDDVKKIWTSDPVTTGILAAPYAIAGAGALIPAATGAVGGASSVPAITTAGGTVVPTLAAPTATGAATGAVPAAAGAAAGAKAAESWLNPSNALGLAGIGLDVGGIVASQIRTKAENDLIEKQKELAAAAKTRMAQVQQEGMNRLGQQILAFAPLNRAMQEMYGQSAGYSPEQAAAMSADPGAMQGFDNNAPPGGPSLQEVQARRQADQQRQAQVSGAFAPAQGPAPLQKRAPQAARRY